MTDVWFGTKNSDSKSGFSSTSIEMNRIFIKTKALQLVYNLEKKET